MASRLAISQNYSLQRKYLLFFFLKLSCSASVCSMPPNKNINHNNKNNNNGPFHCLLTYKHTFLLKFSISLSEEINRLHFCTSVIFIKNFGLAPFNFLQLQYLMNLNMQAHYCLKTVAVLYVDTCKSPLQ